MQPRHFQLKQPIERGKMLFTIKEPTQVKFTTQNSHGRLLSVEKFGRHNTASCSNNMTPYAIQCLSLQEVVLISICALATKTGSTVLMSTVSGMWSHYTCNAHFTAVVWFQTHYYPHA